MGHRRETLAGRFFRGVSWAQKRLCKLQKLLLKLPGGPRVDRQGGSREARARRSWQSSRCDGRTARSLGSRRGQQRAGPARHVERLHKARALRRPVPSPPERGHVMRARRFGTASAQAQPVCQSRPGDDRLRCRSLLREASLRAETFKRGASRPSATAAQSTSSRTSDGTLRETAAGNPKISGPAGP